MTAIPALDTATDPIHSAEDMLQRWRALMGPLGFGQRLLWVGFVGADRRMHKVLSQVPIGAFPHRDLVENLMGALMALLGENFEPGTSVAMLLTRPGCDPVSGADRRWATVLTDHAARLGVPIEPIFRANDTGILVLQSAATVVPPSLRTLNAIHLAAARTAPNLRALITYDTRLAEAAYDLGIPVATP